MADGSVHPIKATINPTGLSGMATATARGHRSGGLLTLHWRGAGDSPRFLMDKRTPSRSKKLAGSRASTPRFGIPSWIVRSSLGLVLIVAGALKLYQLALESQDESMPALFLILFAEAELLGGIWMLSGVDAEKTRKWAVAAFAGLAISSLIQAFAGKCSCGCFGAIAVNPWSAAVFDLGAIALLLLSWPRATSGATTTRSRWLYVGLVSFSLVVTAGGWSQSTTVQPGG